MAGEDSYSHVDFGKPVARNYETPLPQAKLPHVGVTVLRSRG